MEEIKENNYSDTMYLLKFFAILSIVLAHSECAEIQNQYISCCLAIFKLFGVYIFFIISGYYFKVEKYKNIFMLLKDKVIKLMIPWVISGFIVYIFFNRNQINLLEFNKILNWIIGNGTYLYFMTALFIINIIMYILPKKKYIYYSVIVVNLVSIILLNLGILPQQVYSEKIVFTYLNPYLNVLNWMGIFTIGILLKKYDILKKINIKIFITISCAFMITIMSLIILKIEINYWMIIGTILGILNFIILFVIIKKLKRLNIFCDIGKKSFTIYLYHLPVLSIFNGRLEPIYSIITPIIVVFIIYIVIKIGEIICKKIHLNYIYNILLGSRQ